MKFSVFCDGGSRGNPGPAAIGFLVKEDGKVLVEKGLCIGRATNNEAEYRGVIEALKWLNSDLEKIQQQKISVTFFLDSQLVVNQLSGVYKIKSSNLKGLAIQAKSLERELGAEVYYQHIPREKNKQADSLLNKALNQEKLSHENKG